MSAFPRRLATMLTAGGLAVGLMLVAVPAEAATATVAAPDGMVGLTETVWVNAPASANQTIPVAFALNGAASGTLNVALNGRGQGTAAWAPSNSGTWTISASGASTSVTVAAMPTVTTMAIPNSVGLNVPQNIVVTVSALAGAAAPSGTVAIKSAFGPTVATAGLSAVAGSPTASATLSWTPTAPYANPLVAVFTPTAASGFAPSQSPMWSVYVDFPQPVVSLRMPGSLQVGKPVTLTAVLNGVPTTGGVAFNLNVNGVASAIGQATVTSGETSVTWTPASAGSQVITVDYSGTQSPSGFTPTGVSTQATTVAPASPVDALSVSVAGRGPLVVGQAATLRLGTPVMLTSTAASGTTVLLSAAGACALSGNALFATASKGNCALTAFSAGNGSYAANSSTYTFTVQPRAKR